jgi:hypothetical protein
MQGSQESRHFQISKAIFTDMKGSAVGHRQRLVGVLSRPQMRGLPKSLISSPALFW